MSNPVQPAFGTLSPLDVPAAEIVAQVANFNAALLSTNFVDSTTAAVVATLPDAAQCAGKSVSVFHTVHGSGHNVTFATVNSQNINSTAASSLTALSAANTGYVFLSDGNNWFAASGLVIK